MFIPRIQLYPKNLEQFGFEWVRRQFPVRPAFAQTVNASQVSSYSAMHFTEPLSPISTVQGQTLKKVGVWLLGSPGFTHGQLYVAASRVGHPDDLHFAIIKPTKKEELPFLTKNVVYSLC